MRGEVGGSGPGASACPSPSGQPCARPDQQPPSRASSRLRERREAPAAGPSATLSKPTSLGTKRVLAHLTPTPRENFLRKLARRETKGGGPGFIRSSAEESFRHLQLQTRYDTFHASQASRWALSFLRRRSKILELVSAQGILFALTHSGACSAFNLNSGEHLCYLNVTGDQVIRSLFFNKSNNSLITISVHQADNYASLKCRSTKIRDIRSKEPQKGIALFEQDCLRWPGFVEFDDVNRKVLTYSVDSGVYQVFDLKTYEPLYRVEVPDISEVKISPGVMLLVMHRTGDKQPLQVLSIEDGATLAEFDHMLESGKKVDFVEQFSEKLLVKQESVELQILDLKTGSIRHVPNTQFMSPAAFIFLYDKQLFLTFQEHSISVWSFAGELVTGFEDHQLMHLDNRTSNLYITQQQEIIISHCRLGQEGEGFSPWSSKSASINISNILTGKCIAKIQADDANLMDVTALYYDEERNEIYAGNRRGEVHVWARGGDGNMRILGDQIPPV